MNLTTPISWPKAPFKISYQDQLLALGSCFVEHIGKRLQNHKFDLLLNPFGITYNPISIAKGIDRLCTGQGYQQEDLFFHQELWHSPDHHGRFSHEDKILGLGHMNELVAAGNDKVKVSNHLIITLGTAFVFYNKAQQSFVNNCHKLPSSDFDRQLLSVDEIVSDLSKSLTQLFEMNAKINVILTVSPVRHLRDGLIQNQRSKAHLLTAVHTLVEQFPNVHYFPSYEIVMDELRDYRFYDQDMMHPNQQAIEYIWDQFIQYFLEEKDQFIFNEIVKINKAVTHRAFFPKRKKHQEFLKVHYEKVLRLKAKYPNLDLEKELQFFKA